jgi:DNA-binding response OmpR family regulator
MTAPLASLLIVEDDPEISRLLADFLQREGFEVECAGSGKAMDAVLQRMRPDLLVLDLMLPGEDGLSICRRLSIRRSAPPSPQAGCSSTHSLSRSALPADHEQL